MAQHDIARLPTFLVIGAAKAGTTSLHHYLGAHPQISLARETKFFARQGCSYSLHDYTSCFNRDLPILGETCVAYTTFPQHTHIPQRIQRMLPDVKLIYLVRDPIARIESHYWHRYANRTESRDIEQFFAQLTDADDPLISTGKYAMQIEQYLPYFPMSQLMLIDSRDLSLDRQATLRSVFSFLGADDEFSSPRFEQEHKVRTRQVRVSGAGAQLRNSPPARLGRRALPARAREPLFTVARRLLSSGGTLTREPLPEESRAKVARFFRDDVARLRELTGRSFDHWSL